MTIQKKALLDSLKLAMPGIETGNVVLQGADTFIFHEGKIFSYNDSISVTVPLDVAGLVDEPIEGAVHADEFFKVISKFAGDEINFAIAENGTWILKCGKAKAEIALIPFDFESRLKGIEPSDDWTDIDDSFINGVGSCKMANNKTTLAGIYVSGNYICSTDGYQINRFETKYDLPTFWISDNSVAELLKLKGFKFLQLQENWVHFKTENGTIFSIKTLTGNYPIEKINSLLENSKASDDDLHAVFPKDLFNAIDRAGSFSIDIQGHTSIRLIISPKNIEVSSERATGKYTEKVNWDEKSLISKEDFEPITVYVDSTMMEFMAKRTLEFYLIKGALRDGKYTPKLLFISPESKHMMSTFNMD